MQVRLQIGRGDYIQLHVPTRAHRDDDWLFHRFPTYFIMEQNLMEGRGCANPSRSRQPVSTGDHHAPPPIHILLQVTFETGGIMLGLKARVILGSISGFLVCFVWWVGLSFFCCCCFVCFLFLWGFCYHLRRRCPKILSFPCKAWITKLPATNFWTVFELRMIFFVFLNDQRKRSEDEWGFMPYEHCMKFKCRLYWKPATLMSSPVTHHCSWTAVTAA